MSDSSNSNKFYVVSPVSSDYEAANLDVLTKTSKLGTKTHRIVSAVGKDANQIDSGATNFKYLEDHLFSTKGVKSLSSIFDSNYIETTRVLDGCIYKVLRFNRSHNIRTFEFIISYTQVSEYEAKVYKALPVTAQYKGVLLFTGCSAVRNTSTLEELPLKLYAKYESIGDTLNNSVNLDNITEAKGGPGITLAYTFDDDYVYLYIKSISPIRLIPVGDGEYRDISYIEGAGTLIGEAKADIKHVVDPVTGETKVEAFAPNTNLWCDVTLSLKDTTIAHKSDDAEFVDYDNKALSKLAVTLREQSFTLLPTNDGEQYVIGMEPSSVVNMDISPDIRPIRFGCNLLNSSKETITKYANTLRDKIIEAASNIEIVPFTIDTVIRSKGKYNINTGSFIDGQADGFGDIIIRDVGTYNNITAEFDITEYIFDKNQNKGGQINKVGSYKTYKNNASDYLTNITKDHPTFSNIRKTSSILDILTNVDFETPSELEVYFNASFIKASTNFDVVKAYAEFGDEESSNEDDNIIYICKDKKIRIVNFKDYSMENVSVIDLTKFTDVTLSDTITKVDRSEHDDHYNYYIGTDNGLLIVASNLVSNSPVIECFGAFDPNKTLTDKVSFLSTDNTYTYIGSDNGKISIYYVASGKIEYIDSYFKYGTKLLAVKMADEDNIVFVTNNEICSYNLSSKKWNNENSAYHTSIDYDNQYKGLPNPNLDSIIDKQGIVDVPLIQKDIFVYALGLRYDTDRYYPVYKKINLLTGETVDLPKPLAEENQVFKGSLYLDDDVIYCIGGTSISHDADAIDTKLYTYISAFDTRTDTWIELPTNKIKLDDGVTFTANSSIHPVVYNKSIYIVHPKATIIAKNNNTGVWTSKEERKYYVYKIDITDDAITASTLDEDISNAFPSSDVTIIPTSVLNGKIYYYSATPSLANSKYNGYVCTQSVFDTVNNKVTSQTIAICNETEISNDFADDNYINARSDLFSDASVITMGNESLIYCYGSIAIYIYNTEEVLFAESHKLSHTVSGANYLPLLSKGEFDAWKKYNKNDSSKTKLVKLKNYVVFLNGDTCRVSDYLSLDTMSLIPAPMFDERLTGIIDSSILGGHTDDLKVTVSDNFVYEELTSCLVGNEVYLLVTAINDSTYKYLLLKYELDGPSGQIEVVKDITNNIGANSPTKIVLSTISSSKFIILFKDSTGYNCYQYNTEYNTLNSVFTGDNLFAGSKVIYPIVVDSSTLYVLSDLNKGYKISLIGDNSSTITSVVPNAELTDLSKVCENNEPHILKNGVIGNYNFYIVPESDGEKIVEIDTSASILKTKEIYSVPSSKGFTYADVFAKDNYLYFTRGKNGSLLSTEIFKLNTNDLSNANFDIQHAVLSSGSSSIVAPFAISRRNNLYIFGLGRSAGSILKVLKSTINDDTFVSYTNELDISSSSISGFNRYNPTITSFKVNGNEMLAVFSGTQSLATKTSTTVDLFDVKRHLWSSDKLVLPTTLSHLSMMENVIVGGTEEVLSSASVTPYAKCVKINCTDYDSLKFSFSTIGYPKIDGFTYPNYGSYAINKDETVLYITPTYITSAIDGTTNGKAVYKINLTDKTVETIKELDEATYIEGRQVIGSFCHNDDLYLVLYSPTYNKLVFKYYNSSDTVKDWATTEISLNFTPSIDKLYSTKCEIGFDLFNEVTNIINKSIVENDVRAIVTLPDEKTNSIKTVLIKESDSGISTTSETCEYSKLMNGKISDIDEVYINSSGFTYFSDRVNNKIYRSFPNYDNNGFGIKPIGTIDSNKDKVLGRTYKGNVVYSLYSDKTFTALNIDTLVQNTITLDITGEITSCEAIKAFDDKIVAYLGIDNTVTRVDISYSGSVTIGSTFGTTNGSTDFGSLSIISEDEIIHYNEEELTLKNISDNSTTINTKIDLGKYIVGLYDDKSGILYAEVSDSELKVHLINNDEDRLLTTIYIPLNDAAISNIKVIDNVVYILDKISQVYEVVVDKYGNIVSSGFTYITSISSITDKNILIRNTDIIDFDQSVRYNNPRSVNSSHYCFDDLALNYNDEKIFTILDNTDSEGNIKQYVETFDYNTHKLLNKVALEKSVTVSSSDQRFILSTTSDYLYGIIKSGSVELINISTGAVTTLENESVKPNIGIINDINKNRAIIGSNSTGLIYISDGSSLATVELDNLKYTIDFIVSRSEFFTEFYCLGHKDGDTKYTLLKFDGNIYQLINTSTTDINIDENYSIVTTNYGYTLYNGSKAVVFTIDTNNASVKVLKELDDWYNTSDSISSSSYLDSDVTFENNKYQINKVKNIIDLSNYNLDFTFVKECEDKTIIVDKTSSGYLFTFIDVADNKVASFEVETTEFDFNKNNFAYADIGVIHDSAIDNGITKFGHIVTTIDNKFRSLSFKVADPEAKISSVFDITSSDTVSLVYNDANETNFVSSTKSYQLFNAQNNYIGILTDSMLVLETLSSAWKLSVSKTIIEGMGDVFNNNFKIFIVNDYIFMISSSKVGVILNPANGAVYNIDSFDNVCKSYALDSSILTLINNLITDDVLVADNNRVSINNTDFELFLDVVKYCSEYYNEYIGITTNGEVNSLETELNKYTVDSIELNNEANYSSYRSVDNIKVILNMIYKSSSKTITASIPAVSRLNTSKFRISYDMNSAEYVGDIYSFTDNEFNNTLVKYDTSYFDGTFSAVIANNRWIKIKVDDVVYTYSISGNEVPLYNEILPIIIAYGDRTNSDGNTERRYLSFVDIKGNVITYDKELKTFIDISGYVDIDVPYFSTEAMIYPSKAIELPADPDEGLNTVEDGNVIEYVTATE